MRVSVIGLLYSVRCVGYFFRQKEISPTTRHHVKKKQEKERLILQQIPPEPDNVSSTCPETTQTGTTGIPLARAPPVSRRNQRQRYYQFGVCDKGFNILKDFLHPRETHYVKSTRFTCPICKQQFKRQQELASHYANHPDASQKYRWT